MSGVFQPSVSLNQAIFNACDALAVLAGTERPIAGVDPIWQIEKKGCAAIVAYQGSGGGVGTVTSVGLALPSIFSVSGSPVVGAGVLTAVLATQSANKVFIGPPAGVAANPSFRSLIAADIPALPYMSPALASAHMFVGSAGGIATDVAMSGDAALANTGALTLAAVNANAGSFGSATVASIFTVNAKGLITAASSATITPAWGSVTGTPTTVGGYGITDAALNGAVGSSGLTMNTARMMGRTTAGVGAVEEISIGAGLSLTAGTLAATGSGGTVTTVSVASLNGFAGTVANATTTPAITISTSITGLLKGNATAISAATVGTDYSVGTAALGTGILKSTTITGALSIAVAGDFPALPYASSVLTNTHIFVGNGSGLAVDVAASGDVTLANTGAFTVTKINGTSLAGLGTGILKNTTITGVPSIASAASDYVAPSAYASANGLTMATARLLGRTTALAGAAEEISVAGGLSLSLGVLTGAAGTVTAVSVASSNGFAGSSSGGATPILTLSTSITGMIKGNGTALSAATAGTDFSLGTSALGTGILLSTTVTGALMIAVAGDFPTLNQNTTGSAAKWTNARNLAGNSVDGSGNVAFANKFIVQGTVDAGLSSAQFLGALSTGLVKNTITTGILSIASAASDYVAPSAYASANGLTMATARLLGRTTALAGAAEEISVAGGLSLSAGVLTGLSGTVTSVGFTGGIISVATATTTPAFTVAGTSGGIPYFSGTAAWASSALLAANGLVVGGGAGASPSTVSTGTGVLTALGVNVGSAGAFITFGGNAGTPSGLVGTNISGTAASLTAGAATNAVNTAITDDTATNAVMYPTWVTAATGNLPQKVSSTKLTFNPSTGALSSTQLVSTVAIGTAPFAVTSTTNVANLNASSLSGATFAAPGAIGGGTPASGAFTTLSATGDIVRSAAVSQRQVRYQTSGSDRWTFGVNGTVESGANAGSDFSVSRYTDAGAFAGNAIFMNRANGSVSFGATLSASNLDFTPIGFISASSGAFTTLSASGAITLGNAFVAGVVISTGSVTVKDSVGTTYRLLCAV